MDELEAVLPLLPAQIGILVEDRAGHGLYIGQQVVEVTGSMAIGRLQTAWSTLAVHEQVMRSSVRSAGREWYQVIGRHPSITIPVYDLTRVSVTRRMRSARRICAEEREQGIDIVAGPPVRLAAIVLDPTRTWLCLTHHHLGLDGRGVSNLLDGLARCYEGSARVTGTPSLAETVRTLLHRDRLLARTPIEGSGAMNMFGPAMAAPLLATHRQSLALDPALEAAGRHGLTAASLCSSAWLAALATVTGMERPACGLSRDMRPASLPGVLRVAGMLTETSLLSPPGFQPGSVTEGATQVLDHLVTGGGPPAFIDGIAAARRSGATGRPDTLLTIYADASFPQPPSGMLWEAFAPVELTEFAVDATFRLGSDPELQITYDVHRADRSTVEALSESVAAKLADPDRRHPPARRRPLSVGIPRREPSDVDGKETEVLAALAAQVIGYHLGPDEDLVAAGVDSLTLLELAAAATGVGLSLTVADLVDAGSLAMAAVRSRTRIVENPADVERPMSTIEVELFDRTWDGSLGRLPMHEQCLLEVNRVLDLDRLRSAFECCLSAYPSIDRWWEDGPELELTPRQGRPAPFAGEQVDVAMDRVDSLLAEDLAHSFRAGCGPLLRLRAIVDGSSTLLLLSFHHALLDGWSFGTLIRSLQSSYLDGSAPRADPGTAQPPGARASSTLRWLDLVRDVIPAPRPSVSEPQVGRAVAWVNAEPSAVSTGARASGATEATFILAAAAISVSEALAPSIGPTLAIRMSTRDGRQSATATVGQLTADVPVPRIGSDLAGAIRAITTARVLCLEVGPPDWRALRSALGWTLERAMTDTTLVVENYDRFDEDLVRAVGVNAWPEASSWRRDVSPTWRTVTMEEHDGRWSVELQTVIDDDPSVLVQTIARHLGDRIAGRRT